jgi:hypothetical protein
LRALLGDHLAHGAHARVTSTSLLRCLVLAIAIAVGDGLTTTRLLLFRRCRWLLLPSSLPFCFHALLLLSDFIRPVSCGTLRFLVKFVIILLPEKCWSRCCRWT